MASADQKIANGRQLPLPCPAEIALAIIVVQSKPVDLKIEEYLKQVRASITEGPRGQLSSPAQPQNKHIDSAAYWKGAFHKSEALKVQLLDKVYTLEQQKITKQFEGTVVEASVDQDNLKATHDETPVIVANRGSKRKAASLKTPTSPATDGASRRNLQILDLLREDSPTNGPVRLLRDFFELRTLLVSPSSDCTKILTAARRVCRTISAIIEAIVFSSKASQDDNTTGYGNVATEESGVWPVLDRSYTTLLGALGRLAKDSDGVLTLISEVTRMLRRILVSLELVLSQDKELGHKGKVPRTRKDMHLQATHEQVVSNMRTVAYKLAKFMVHIMTIGCLQKQPQSELFEPLISTFLHHLASKLSLLAFSDGDFPYQGLVPPCGLENMIDIKDQTLVQSTIAQAPYLVFALRKLMAFIDKNGDDNNMFPSAIRQNTNQGNLAQKINKLLQNTLLRGVFGDQDSAFRDGLRSTNSIGGEDEGELNEIFEEHEVTSEWFIGEVWSYLGWDVLAQQLPLA